MKSSYPNRQFGVGEGICHSRGLPPWKPRIQIWIQICMDNCSKILLCFYPPHTLLYYPNLLYFSPVFTYLVGPLYELPARQMHFLSWAPHLSPQWDPSAQSTISPCLYLHWLEVPSPTPPQLEIWAAPSIPFSLTQGHSQAQRPSDFASKIGVNSVSSSSRIKLLSSSSPAWMAEKVFFTLFLM